MPEFEPFFSWVLKPKGPDFTGTQGEFRDHATIPLEGLEAWVLGLRVWG